MKAHQSLEPNFGAADFARVSGVSRETMARFEIYADLLRKWQKAIGLVGASTLPDLWRRHFLDSAQLYDLAPEQARNWVDIGTGAGFPGLVLAIMGAQEVHLIESDSRKCAFLKEAARLTAAPVIVHNCRADQVHDLQVDVVTARAVAPLVDLLELAQPFCHGRTICLFPKGQDVVSELTDSSKYWEMNCETIGSRSDPMASILRIRTINGVQRARTG